jgi:protein FRG1
MVKALTFKGDKKAKKRKRVADPNDAENLSSKAVTTTSGAPTASEDDDSWVTADAPNDVSGPVLIVLPTEPATCLACDANGKVYASAIENFVDGDPTTAEPHDVRQVFVANRVAGTESISLKGHHGRCVALHLNSFPVANIAV